jgi:type I restriction enzyme, S subunit
VHDIVSSYVNSTAVNMLPIDGVQKPEIIVPPRALVTPFDRLATQVEGRREEMVAESRTLAALYNTQLPKLISGAFSIPAIEMGIEVTCT